MNIGFVPSVCKGDNATFKGSIIIRVPTFFEKMEYQEKADLNFAAFEKLSQEGLTQSEKLDIMKSISPSIRKLAEMSVKHYVKIDLERVSDGKKFSSFEDMSYEPDCGEIIMEVANGLLTQFASVGKA